MSADTWFKSTSRLDAEIEALVARAEMSPAEHEARRGLLARLKRAIQASPFKGAGPEPVLVPFGSYMTGLSLSHGDMDICLLAAGPPMEDDDYRREECETAVRILGKAFTEATLENGETMFIDVEPIPHSVVPIVKFTDRLSGVKCDLSYDNRLAVRNSQLLAAYVSLDPRMRPLCLVVKEWAKMRCINNPRKPYYTLSSYGYVLMVIFFLQKVNPPILPCLQQLQPLDGGIMQDRVLGFNCYHFKVDSEASRLYARIGHNNKASVGTLLHAFLVFYCYSDMTKTASIRMGAWLEANVKKNEWDNKTRYGLKLPRKKFFIEDPFNLTHDLGRQYTSASINDTLDQFHGARKSFDTTPVTLSNMLIPRTDGIVTEDLCFRCRKPGHQLKDCPRATKKKKAAAAAPSSKAPAAAEDDDDDDEEEAPADAGPSRSQPKQKPAAKATAKQPAAKPAATSAPAQSSAPPPTATTVAPTTATSTVATAAPAKPLAETKQRPPQAPLSEVAKLVKIEVLEPGTGTESPREGDRVTIHYIGRVQGEDRVFDSSVARKQPYSFDVGSMAGVRGWSLAVQQMRTGERADVTMPAECGYGAKGSSIFGIPPNAALVYEITLVSWSPKGGAAAKATPAAKSAPVTKTAPAPAPPIAAAAATTTTATSTTAAGDDDGEDDGEEAEGDVPASKEAASAERTRKRAARRQRARNRQRDGAQGGRTAAAGATAPAPPIISAAPPQ